MPRSNMHSKGCANFNQYALKCLAKLLLFLKRSYRLIKDIWLDCSPEPNKTSWPLARKCEQSKTRAK